jgi:hypothetical protein
MLSDEDKIRLIHDCRNVLINRMFDELSRRPGSCAEQVSDEIIATLHLNAYHVLTRNPRFFEPQLPRARCFCLD